MGDSDSDESSLFDEQHYIQRNGKWVPMETRQNKYNSSKEQYYVQRGGKWVSMDESTSRADGNEYFVQRNGKWVKMDNNSSLRNAIVGGISNEVRRSDARGVSLPQQVVSAIQNPQQTVVSPGPQEHREYIVYVTNPPTPVPQPVPAPQPVIQQVPVPRAAPNEYYTRNMPPRRRPPPQPAPPPVIMEPQPRPRPIRRAVNTGDAYERGRAAFLQDQMSGLNLQEDDYQEDPDNPGYYLAGYIHYQYPEQTQQSTAASEAVSVQTVGTAQPVQVGGLQFGYSNQFAPTVQQCGTSQPVAQLDGLPVFQGDAASFQPVQPPLQLAQLPAQSPATAATYGSYQVNQAGYQVGQQGYQVGQQPAQIDGLPVFDGNSSNFQPIQPAMKLAALPGGVATQQAYPAAGYMAY